MEVAPILAFSREYNCGFSLPCFPVQISFSGACGPHAIYPKLTREQQILLILIKKSMMDKYSLKSM
jgi:hypothetical protein